MGKGTQVFKKKNNIANFSEWVWSAQKLVFSSAVSYYLFYNFPSTLKLKNEENTRQAFRLVAWWDVGGIHSVSRTIKRWISWDTVKTAINRTDFDEPNGLKQIPVKDALQC